jgi:3-mercaptopyruvate sulfurtransferase SseA
MFMASEIKHPKLAALEERARLFIKAEIKRANLTYDELAERLKKHGFNENSPSIANKLARGTFSATFLLAVLKAIGKENVNLSEIYD